MDLTRSEKRVAGLIILLAIFGAIGIGAAVFMPKNSEVREEIIEEDEKIMEEIIKDSLENKSQ